MLPSSKRNIINPKILISKGGDFLMYEKTDITFLSYGCEVRKMKRWNCHKRKRDSYWNPGYCPVCALYQKEIKREGIVEIVDEMIVRWDSNKQFKYYERTSDHICFLPMKGRKQINYLSWSDKVTLLEAEEPIKLIAYKTTGLQHWDFRF